MVEELPDKFNATDPVTGNTIRVDAHGHDFHSYVYEYGASSPVVMNQETVRAIMSEGARRERENVIEIMEKFRARTDVENEGDLLLDIMDDIVGWCSPKGKKPDDPNHPRGKPHKWEPGFLERIASLSKPPNDGSD